MRRLLARPSLLLLAAVCLSLASCSSNNKGKIVGKWKAVAAPNAKADTEVFLEFTADGRATMTKVEGGQTETLFNATYSLGMGDWVTMSGITPAPRVSRSPATRSRSTATT